MITITLCARYSACIGMAQLGLTISVPFEGPR